MNARKGCNFGPRCDYFEEGRCNAGDIPMVLGARTRDRHDSRCLKWNEIDWDAPPKARKVKEKLPIGQGGPEDGGSEEILLGLDRRLWRRH